MQLPKKRRTPKIWARLRRVVALPVALLLALWIGASGYLAYNASVKFAVAESVDTLSIPAGQTLTALADERSTAMSYLVDPEAHEESYSEAQSGVDQAMEPLLRAVDELQPRLHENVQERTDQISTELASLDSVRERVSDLDIREGDALREYGSLTAAVLDLFEAQVRSTDSTEASFQQVGGIEVTRSLDHLNTADARIQSSLATGELSPRAQYEFAQSIGAYRDRINAIGPLLDPDNHATLETMTSSESWAELQEQADSVIAFEPRTETDPATGRITADRSVPISADTWDSAVAEARHDLHELAEEQAALGGVVIHSEAVNSAWLAVLISFGLLSAMIVALWGARRTSRSIARRLFQLRDETQELAQTRLPEVVAGLSRASPVDTRGEPSPLTQDFDEVGEVARAFGEAQEIAVRAAVRQSELRHGANRAFLSIAHRSQALLQRQLRILDKMEREQQDPEHLTDLFTLDHLATRSRRTTDNLLIIGGESVGRPRRQPVALIDVLRAAMSETGDYSRINREQAVRASVRGEAAPDVIHLVAELLDNATTHSPRHTVVHLRAVEATNGVAIEVEDRGEGMGPEAYVRANATLTSPPEFDVTHFGDDVQLGFSVVSHLAARHSMRVQLRDSPFGGVQVIVLLPRELLTAEEPQALESSDAPAEPPIQPGPFSGPEPKPAVSGTTVVTEPVVTGEQTAPAPVETAPWEESAPVPTHAQEGEAPLPRRVRRTNASPASTPIPSDDAPEDEAERLQRMKKALSGLQRAKSAQADEESSLRRTAGEPGEGGPERGNHAENGQWRT